jgi:hypothetical protein
VTRRPSSTIGKKFRSRTGSVGPCILWEKAHPAFIDPTKVGSFALDPPVIYPSFSLGSWWSSSKGFLPLSSLEEAMTPLKLRSISWQKQVETKTRREHDIQTSGNPRGYIGEK